MGFQHSSPHHTCIHTKNETPFLIKKKWGGVRSAVWWGLQVGGGSQCWVMRPKRKHKNRWPCLARYCLQCTAWWNGRHAALTQPRRAREHASLQYIFSACASLLARWKTTDCADLYSRWNRTAHCDVYWHCRTAVTGRWHAKLLEHISHGNLFLQFQVSLSFDLLCSVCVSLSAPEHSCTMRDT
jgi:hypothetical protein